MSYSHEVERWRWPWRRRSHFPSFIFPPSFTFPPSMLLQTPPSDVSMSDLRYDICASPQVRLIPLQEHITERTCKCAQPVSVDMLVDSLAIPRVVCTGVVLSRAIRGDREIYVGQLNAVIRFNFSICSAHS